MIGWLSRLCSQSESWPLPGGKRRSACRRASRRIKRFTWSLDLDTWTEPDQHLKMCLLKFTLCSHGDNSYNSLFFKAWWYSQNIRCLRRTGEFSSQRLCESPHGMASCLSTFVLVFASGGTDFHRLFDWLFETKRNNRGTKTGRRRKRLHSHLKLWGQCVLKMWPRNLDRLCNINDILNRGCGTPHQH